MQTLYFSPGACSLASHIGLEETGAPYEVKPTLLAKGEQKTEAYLKINPRGKVPALSVDGKILVENTAILTYLARRFSEKRLIPTDPAEEARCIGTMCWFSSVVHPSYQRSHRPERFAEGEAAQATVKETGRKSFWANCQPLKPGLARLCRANRHRIVGAILSSLGLISEKKIPIIFI